MKLSKKKYLEKCKEFLDCMGVDYTKDTMYLSSGGNSCICNPDSPFIELFGESINSVTSFVAGELGKKVGWSD